MFMDRLQKIWELKVASGLSNIKAQPCHPAFLAPDQLFNALDRVATPLSANKGDSVFREGALATGVYLLRSGSVRAYLTHRNGNEIVNRVLGPGAVLGFPAAMCSRTFQFNAEVVEPAALGFVETSQLNEFLRTRPDLCMQVVSMMSDELIQLREKRDHMKTCTKTSCSLHGSCKCAV